MKSNNIIWNLLILFSVSLFCLGFASCSSDDDDSSSGVIGTWSGHDYDDFLTLSFKKDGSGTWIEHYSDSYSGSETESGTFSYEMEGRSRGIIIVRYYDSYYGYESEVLFFEIEGKKMFLYGDGYGDDLEWVLTKQ